MGDESDNPFGNPRRRDDSGSYDLAPDPSADWYWAEGDQRHGPVTGEELRDRIRAGKLTSDQLVWRAGMEDWRAAGTLPVLQQAFHAPVSPAIPPVAPSNTLQYRTAPTRDNGFDSLAGQATGAMVCGIIAVFFGMPGICCLPISAVTLVLGLIALVLGYNARASTSRGGQATAGIVLGWISLALCVLSCGFTFALGISG
ncbi:MAG: GYF domain-containing protein [Planctomycetota bacterium]